MCGRYYIAEDDLSDELSRMIDELNRKKTPEGLKKTYETEDSLLYDLAHYDGSIELTTWLDDLFGDG